jgi:hypothetical protein
MTWENLVVVALVTRVRIPQRVQVVVRGCGHGKMKKWIGKEGLLPLNPEPVWNLRSDSLH